MENDTAGQYFLCRLFFRRIQLLRHRQQKLQNDTRQMVYDLFTMVLFFSFKSIICRDEKKLHKDEIPHICSGANNFGFIFCTECTEKLKENLWQ